MSDDIVVRLRKSISMGCICASCDESREAADIIEHLRQELLMALGRTCRCVNTGATNE